MRFFFRGLLGFTFFISFLPVSAQHTPEKIFVSVEQMPEFAGGQDSLMAFIGRNIRYPQEALQNNQQGMAILSFVVDATGQVMEPKILKSAAPSLDAEAIRVIGSLPRWKPGKQNGQPVAVRMNLPVRFQLAPENTLPVSAAPQDSVVLEIDEQPRFPGGEGAMMAFLGKNIKYPKDALENKTEGLSVVTFVVDENGGLSTFRVIKRLGWGTDEEAIRVLRSMPRWQPGKKNGKPVKVRYTLPVRFSL